MNRLKNRKMPGFVNLAMYEILMDATNQIPGVMMELGIHRAVTFEYIYRHAIRYKRPIHGVDSFIGMPRPLLPGDERFPEGVFDTWGSDWFRKQYPEVVVHEGFIPEIFKEMKIDSISFCHIDLDHQKSTMEALDWTWERLAHRGIIVCHDFHLINNVCAPKAIRDWMDYNKFYHIGECDHSIWFRKGISDA